MRQAALAIWPTQPTFHGLAASARWFWPDLYPANPRNVVAARTPARYYPPSGSPRESWRMLYYVNLTASLAIEVLGQIEGNEGSFDDGLLVQEVVNAVAISHRERRRLSLPLEPGLDPLMDR